MGEGFLGLAQSTAALPSSPARGRPLNEPQHLSHFLLASKHELEGRGDEQ